MVKPIYTMPDKFMEDESVPVKWRLYGLVNGFWLNGLPVYASNGFFADKLKCSERHIARAFEELEKAGLLTRNVTGYKRLVLQGGMTPDVMGGRHGASGEGDVGGHPNASSNSSNLTISSSSELQVVTDDEKPPKEKKDTTYRQVFALWGKYPLSWNRDKTQIESAKNILQERGLEEAKKAFGFYQRYKKDPYCPSILKPSDLDRKWVNLEAFNEKV